MYHQHFNSIDSTQIYLKDNLDSLKSFDSNILISTNSQTNGIGRNGNIWDDYTNSLALSFTLKPNMTASLSPLEVGLIVIKFIKKKFNEDIFLKWPNDLLTKEGKKCGGILCQYIDSKTIIVGLGINLGGNTILPNKKYRHGLGSINNVFKLTPDDYKQLSAELYEFIIQNRISSDNIINFQFKENCIHMNKKVILSEDSKEIIGKFIGIGEFGEALIELDGVTHKFLNSSLTLLD